VKINLLSFFLFVVSGLFAQDITSTIRGIVSDADSKYPIPGVNVFLISGDSIRGVNTDGDGKFRFEGVKVGRHALKVSMIGYEEKLIRNIVLNSGKELIMNIEITEKAIVGEEVDIYAGKDKTKANNDLVTNSSRNFQSEETERYAGTRNDPSKMVANYAGVSSGNDARNDIIVRGNSPLGVLWRLEGVNIPNPNHFSTQGATGGPISILNNNLLGASDFLTGAFPAEYGNRTAAVFDLKLRVGNNEKREYTAQAGINGFELGAEGPISRKKGSSYLASYRYSTFAVFDALGIRFGVSGIPEYNDGAFKITLPVRKEGIVTLWGIGGNSRIKLLDSQRDSANWAFTGAGEDLIFGSGMGAGGVSHFIFFNPSTSGKFSLSFTLNRNSIVLDSLIPGGGKFNIYDNQSRDYTAFTSYTLSKKLNAFHLIKGGVIYEHFFVNYNSRYFSRNYQVYLDEFREENASGMAQGFMHWQWKTGKRQTLNTGVHAQHFLLNNSYSIEPRLGWTYRLTEKQNLSFAYGLHTQTQPFVYYFLRSYADSGRKEVQTNLNLGFSKAHHFVLGFDYNISSSWRFKSETFYQYLFDIPLEKNSNSSFSLINVGNDLEGFPMVDSLENAGKGKNYGIEFTLEKFFGKGYYFLTTLSLYESKYQGSDGIWRHTAYSGGYVYNILGGYERAVGKQKNKIISLDIKFNIAAGNRYTPIHLDSSRAKGYTVYIDSLAWSEKFRNYSKLDIKPSFKINRPGATHIIFVNVENILNRKNILRQVFDPRTGQVRVEHQLGVFPYGGYRIEF
jgi:hypothetical protein